MRRWALPLMLCAAAPVAAQDGGLRDRLRALADRAPTAQVDPYAAEKSADLARIGAEAAQLFAAPGDLGPPDAQVRIALFISSDCPDCDRALQDLRALCARLGIAARVFDTAKDADSAQVMARLGLDLTPSYVMADRLIRGQMPGFVLERYLSPPPADPAPEGE
ncbi:thioredoxin domain-containing protein [Tropicibacter oceani]|uniref:Thioredoxin domain-containing protein n=1 Tax=Tropicibacter oceani TaxID=3058420 RepID=A0ABY8QDW2_9RHOB|nr:hypothetical protein [Tropicibacter oceani]WGW02695.1 hypothetical protein QF118_12180 [Tropicibacter oceani]